MKYYIDDNLTPLSDERFQEELSRVSNQRKEKIMKFRFESGRMQSLRAYQLLQKLLLEEFSISTPPLFREEANGKPVIVGHEDIHFNLSHCKNGVACAISREPIGIDIETIPDSLNKDLARYVFNEREQDMILEAKGKDLKGNTLSPQIMFTRLWTMKEALVKMTGTGISGKEQLLPLLEEWHNNTSNYDFVTIQSPDIKWVCSLCFPKA